MTANDSKASAYDRASINIPKFKNWSVADVYDFEKEIVDYETLEDLNRTINQARLALFKTGNSISKYERLEKAAKLEYDRARTRELLKSTAKTEGERRARADLQCEDLENEWLMAQQIREELVRFSYTMRLELQTLQGLGNNIRQQMKVM